MFFLSEIQQTLSAPLEDVAASISQNGICLKVSTIDSLITVSILSKKQSFQKTS